MEAEITAAIQDGRDISYSSLVETLKAKLWTDQWFGDISLTYISIFLMWKKSEGMITKQE